MSKQYRYRKHIRWGQYVLPIYCGILALVPWVAIILFGIFRTGSWEFFLRLLIKNYAFLYPIVLILTFFSFIFFLVGIFLGYLSWRMARVCVSLDSQGIIYKYYRGEKRIRFDSISQIKFSFIPYAGGWIKIISKEHTIRLTVVLENIGDFLKELKTALDERGLSDRYDKARFFRFLKTAVFSDQSWARGYAIFWRIILMMILAGAIGFAFALLCRCGIRSIILWTGLSILWPMVVYFAPEIMFGRRIAKESVEESFICPSRDTIYEKVIYRKAVLIGALLYLGISVIILVLLLFSSKRKLF